VPPRIPGWAAASAGAVAVSTICLAYEVTSDGIWIPMIVPT